MSAAPASDAPAASPNTQFVALLRAVNVGGAGKVAMADLRAMLADLGFGDVQTLLQSGNIVFRGGGRSPEELEQLLEGAAAQRLGLRTVILVRTPAEWRELIESNPFPQAAEHDPSHLVAMALRDAPDPAALDALRSTIAGPELVEPGSRHLYIVYPDGIGPSKLTGAKIEKALGTLGTARNWNTILRIGDLLR